MFGHDEPQQTDTTSNAPVDAAASDASAGAPMPDVPTFDTSSDGGPADTPAPAAPTDAHTDELLTIKQNALKQLSPLVSHLDQSPEEKFRTTMMMIQAADDQALIKDAYEAAQNITDEKARAQALLDIVNEINYFTQHS